MRHISCAGTNEAHVMRHVRTGRQTTAQTMTLWGRHGNMHRTGRGRSHTFLQAWAMLCRPLGAGTQHLSVQQPGLQPPMQSLAGHSHKALIPLDHADIEDHADFGWYLLVAVLILIDGTLLLSGLRHAMKGSQCLCSAGESEPLQ